MWRELAVAGPVFLTILAGGNTANAQSGDTSPPALVQSVNQSTVDSLDKRVEHGERSPVIVAVQILLDRAGYSVGVIDGYLGDNLSKALKAFTAANGLPATGTPNGDVWKLLSKDPGEPRLVEYTITSSDVAGPYPDNLPSDYAEMAKLDRMAFTSPAEMLAERFHMDVDFLKSLNDGKSFGNEGTVIWVANIGSDLKDVEVVDIIVDVDAGSVSALDKDGKLVAHYPATIGSKETPSPSGTHTVEAVAIDPTYTYRPSVNFQQGDNDEKLTIPPGPNGPVGSVWIDLSEPTYGLHGTPEPALIDKSNSHGCVRLTNWDASELAHIVAKGATVEFRRS